MDIRIQKTRRSIYNAFIEIRSRKPIEKITVKELCETAQINKSTFYVYYKDIYDLSDQIEDEIVTSVIHNIGNYDDIIINDTRKFALMLCTAYSSQQNLISIIFSGIRTEQLPRKIEFAIKNAVFEVYPHYKNDLEFNIKLTYSIYGGYYAFNSYRNCEDANIAEIIGIMSAKIFS